MYQYFLANERQKALKLTVEANRLFKNTHRLLMRFQLFCLFFLVMFLQTALGVNAQPKLSLDVRQASLEDVLQHIRQQSGLDYVIQPDHIKAFTPLTLQLKDVDISTLLDLCFQGQPLTYKVTNNTIIVTGQQQRRTITGVVTDANKVPLAGASVRLKGTSNQTRTDEKGVFRLDNIPRNAVLEIRYLGYETRQIDLSATEAQELGPIFILKQHTSAIEEITIQANTGYQKLDPGKATGSMVVIDEKKIQESPALSLMQRLEGQIPGVQFNMKTNDLLVRSANSYYGARGPLIVIDGFPAMEQRLSTNPTGDGRLYATNQSASILNNFNPDNIASITVLKDAAAAAIWGSRAANGVIVIETKAGRGGRNSVNFSSTMGISAPADMDKLKTMDAAEYIDFEKELFDNNFYYDPISGWRAPNISDALHTMFSAQRGDISLEERDRNLSQLSEQNNRKQIRDHLLQSALTQQYNLSFNGSVNNAKYFASVVHDNDRPIYRANNSNNTSLTFNLENSYFNNKLRISLGVNHMLQKSQVNSAALRAISPGNFGLKPYDMLLDGAGNTISRYYEFTPSVMQERFESQGYLPWSYNHIDELKYNNDQYDDNKTRVTASLNYRAFTWLNAALSGSYQRGLRNMESLRDEEGYEMRSLINLGTTIDGTGKLIRGVPVGGKFVTSNYKGDDYSLRFQLDGSKTWNAIHEVNVFAGTEIRQNTSMGYLQTRYGFDKDTYQSVVINPTVPYKDIYGGNKTLNIQDAPVNIDRIRYLSYYANAGYTLMDKYYLTGSMRFDDATIIGVERTKRAKPFWSAGLRWDLHKEHFMDSQPWINSLSLRSSIGTGGSVPTNGTAFTLYSPSIIDALTQLPTGSISIPGNQMLGWENTRTFNTGLDLRTLRNRLGFTIDVYSKRSYGIMASVPYNATYGWSNLTFNTSNMKSNGVDIIIEGSLIQKAEWIWNSSFNIAYSDNEVTDSRFPRTSNTPSPASLPIDGYPIDQIFAYRWAGLDDKGRSQISDASGNILDADASTVDFAPEDLVYTGRSSAPYFGGWTNNVTYKNLTFTARITMNFGHKVRWKEVNSSQYPNNPAGFTGFLSNSKALVDRWRKPGDELRTDIPGIINTSFNNINRFEYADINVLDASHIRLQLLSLDYNFPSHLLNGNKTFRSLRLGATASNIGLLWKKTDRDIDPEYMFDGNYSSMPPVTSYMVRLIVGF